MVIEHAGTVEVDERFRRYSHRLLRALKSRNTAKKAIIALDRPDESGRYALEIKLYLSARATTVTHTAPNAFAAMDVCYYDLKKRLMKRRAAQRRSEKSTLVQRIALRIRRK